jgi:hypothetical protein
LNELSRKGEIPDIMSALERLLARAETRAARSALADEDDAAVAALGPA